VASAAPRGEVVTGPRDHDPLPYRRDMEAAFGEDFSKLKVRVGDAGPLAAIGARAAATGDEVAFASATPDRRTVAHELAHVVQHRRHGPGAEGISQPGDPSELEAEAVASAVDAGGPAPAIRQPMITPRPPAAPSRAGDPAAPAAAKDPTAKDPPAKDPGAKDPAAKDPAASKDLGAKDPGAKDPGAKDPAASKDPGAKDPGAKDPVTTQPVASAAHAPAAPSPPGVSDPKRAAEARPARANPVERAGGAVGQAADLLHGHDHALSALHGAKLGELPAATRGVAQQVTAASATPIVPPPRPSPRFAPATPTPAPVQPPAVAPAAARAPAPVAHEAHPAPASPITAGPRPRVPLAERSDPATAHHALQAGQRQLDARLAQTHRHSVDDRSEARLHAAIAPPPAPAAPPVRLPDSPPPPAAGPPLPAGLRPKLEPIVAPALDRRIAQLTATAQQDTAQTTAELARLDAQHAAAADARHAQADTRVAALRSSATARVTARRGQLHTEQQATRDQITADLHAQHATMEADVQASVAAGEARAHAHLTTGETSAAARKAQADARIAAIHAAAEAKAAAPAPTARSIARDVDHGIGDPPTPEEIARAALAQAKRDADRELAAAQHDMDELLAHAAGMSREEIARRETEIAHRLVVLRTTLEARVAAALGDRFPRLEATYTNEIELLVTDVIDQVIQTGDDLVRGEGGHAAADWAAAQAVIARRTERLHGTLADANALATFDDTDGAFAAFGITMTGKWSADRKEDMLSQAIRMENAFRAADKKGLLAEAGLTAPGAAFNALMNEGQGTTMHYIGAGGDGATTQNAGLVDYYTITSDRSVGLANGQRFHFGHELGHMFNAGMANKQNHTGSAIAAPYRSDHAGAFETDPVMLDGAPLAGGTDADGPKRFVPTGDDLSGILRDPARMEALRAKYEAQGMQMDPTHQRDGGILIDSPFQQHLTNAAGNRGEWFADIFVNWTNGTLAETPGGDAIDAWMDDHAQDWIELALTPQPVDP
jgi:hypothetical protein